MSLTLFEKLWRIHEITQLDSAEYLINIDRVFLHERTGGIALLSLEESGRAVASPQNVFCTMDHIVSTKIGRGDTTEMPGGEKFITSTRAAAQRAGINLFDLNSPHQGIVHVISPELGIAQPGMTIVCPDSHTCTLGGLGVLAWGIGSTNAEHALATNTLRVTKPKVMRVVFDGELRPGVYAKDLIIHLIALLGTTGGSGYAIEFAGDAISSLPIEGRLTLCNMAVEMSAFTGLVAPDQKTYEYLEGKPYAPKDENWTQAMAHWQTLFSDPKATFDKEVVVDARSIKPSVTWGTSPQDTVSIDDYVPDPAANKDINASRRDSMNRSLEYMALEPRTKITDIKVDAAFIGSCTNSRLSDLRVVAEFLRDKKVADGVAAVCVPGSKTVKQQAEEEGLDQVFINAGFEWREPGCSMCFYAGGETFGANKRVISSTNRNFEGRQGPGTRTHLASPLTVAASACAGFIADAHG